MAPMMRFFLSKPISMYFPNRLLLSFRFVFAFPMAFDHRHAVMEGYWPPVQTVYCCGLSPEGVLPYLHDGIGGQHLILHIGLHQGATDSGKVPHHVLGWDGLPGPRFPADDNRLVPLVPGGGMGVCSGERCSDTDTIIGNSSNNYLLQRQRTSQTCVVLCGVC